MCINGGENSDGPKTCGQAGYVIYNTSPESFLKFKQVSNYEEFARIDNYEYRFDILNLENYINVTFTNIFTLTSISTLTSFFP